MATADPIPKAQPAAQETQKFREQMGQVSRQSAVFFAGTVFTAAAAYLFKIYLARELGARALGIYALGMTVVGFLGVFNALGLHRAALRFVPAYCATKRVDLLRGFLWRAMLVLVVANVILGAAVLWVGPWVAVRFYHTPELIPYLWMFVAIMLLGVLTAFLGHVLGGYKAVARRTVLTNFISTPAMMILTVILVMAGLSLWGYLAAQIASAVTLSILMAVAVWKLTPRPARSFGGGLPPFEKEVVAFSGAALGLSFLDFLMSQTDRIAIGIYRDPKSLGVYAVAASMIVFVTVILRSVNQIFGPIISDLHAREQPQVMRRMYQTLTKWILGLTVPLAGVMIFFAPGLMGIFGRDFRAGWLVLVIGTAAQLINCGVGSSGTMLLMSGHQNTLVKVHAGSAALMVVLCFVLTPRWGINGAALSLGITTGVTNLWYLIEVKRKLSFSPYNRTYVRLVVPLLGTVAAIWLLQVRFGDAHPQWLVITLSAVAAYVVFTGLALTMGLDADDRMIARAVWSRIRSVIPRTEAGI